MFNFINAWISVFKIVSRSDQLDFRFDICSNCSDKKEIRTCCERTSSSAIFLNFFSFIIESNASCFSRIVVTSNFCRAPISLSLYADRFVISCCPLPRKPWLFVRNLPDSFRKIFISNLSAKILDFKDSISSVFVANNLFAVSNCVFKLILVSSIKRNESEWPSTVTVNSFDFCNNFKCFASNAKNFSLLKFFSSDSANWPRNVKFDSAFIWRSACNLFTSSERLAKILSFSRSSDLIFVRSLSYVSDRFWELTILFLKSSISFSFFSFSSSHLSIDSCKAIASVFSLSSDCLLNRRRTSKRLIALSASTDGFLNSSTSISMLLAFSFTRLKAASVFFSFSVIFVDSS